ncbi:MAG TPA: response regulator [Vicinamibacterales bacterium]|jgi:DNA-binding NtrC family response regulator|nr:response regulator [Acidobacteriota bacterium]HQX82781.1 response regulator [Vicinamibacterales bacterium]
MATILVVDDEPSIRQLIARILERQGHRVIICGDAVAALAVEDAIDLLIVDYVLPNVNGRELTEKFRERQPTLPVILMSGYLPSPDLAPPPPSAFMQKPMRTTMVVETVNKMLAG